MTVKSEKEKDVQNTTFREKKDEVDRKMLIRVCLPHKQEVSDLRP